MRHSLTVEETMEVRGHFSSLQTRIRKTIERQC